MRRYTITKSEETVAKKEVSIIICNQCGKEIKVPSAEESLFKHDVAKAEVFEAKHCWGYGSKYDSECHTFDLCADCYDKLIEGFQVKIERK